MHAGVLSLLWWKHREVVSLYDFNLLEWVQLRCSADSNNNSKLVFLFT